MTRLIAAIILGVLLCREPTEAARAETGARFIPVELIAGATWNGEQAIAYPQGTFHEGVAGGRDPQCSVRQAPA